MAEIRCDHPQCDFSFTTRLSDNMPEGQSEIKPADFEDHETLSAIEIMDQIWEHHQNTRPALLRLDRSGGHDTYDIIPEEDTCNIDLSNTVIRINHGRIFMNTSKDHYR